MLRIMEEALTYDDVLLVPAHSTVLPNTADLRTRLTSNIQLNIPMISAAMDTVTESNLAIALAQEGGIGFIHKNMSIERQAQEIARVKRYENGMVTKPVTVHPEATIREVLQLAGKVLDEGVAWIMTDLLKSVVSRGIAGNAAISGVEVGGKTGTTNLTQTR